MPSVTPRLLTLGRFELVVDSPAGSRAVPSQAKRLALLAYLSAQSPHGFRRRDTLLGLLWPELGQDEARRALRQALHYLRQQLGDNAIVTRADDQIGIGDGLSSDVVEFEQAVAEKRWADALALYHGPFLDGVFVPNVAAEFEEWIERTRLRLKSAATAAAWQLAGAAESAGDESAADHQPSPVVTDNAAALTATSGELIATRVRRPRMLALLVAVVILAVVAAAYTMATIRSSASDPVAPGLLQTRDRVLVSDFNNQTANSTLGVVLAEALRVDIAHRRLGALYSAVAEPGRAATALERAFAYRERLPLRERYLTMGSYYRVVTREYKKAAAAYRALLELYPQDLAGLNNIALVYFADRQFARADSFLSQVIALDSTIPSVYLGRAEALISQSRFDSARHVLDRVWERFPEYPQTRLTEAYLAAARQDWPTAERHLRLRLAASRDREFDQINAQQMLGQIALLGGRLAEAEQHLSTALALAQSNELSGRYLTHTILLAWLDLLYRRQPGRALARVDSALQKFPLERLDPGDRPYIELADLYTAADQPARARALLAAAERDSAAAATLRGAGWHELRGIVALAEGRARAAVSELRQADAVDNCTICVLPNLANAYRLAGDAQSAIATYERYLTTPWIWRFETDATHMAFSLQQLAELYRQQRQPARAAEQYMRLLRLWSAADPELSGVVAAVRASLARAGGATETR